MSEKERGLTWSNWHVLLRLSEERLASGLQLIVVAFMSTVVDIMDALPADPNWEMEIFE
jgi:hypothetical protein